MVRVLKHALVVSLLGLAACLRFGYASRPAPAADGGNMYAADAGRVTDAGTRMDAGGLMDAAMAVDAGALMDASAASDAAIMPVVDAGVVADAAAKVDAAIMSDASMMMDASMQDAAVGCTPGAAMDYCTQLPALARAPLLDGVLDCGPSLIDLPASGWNSTKAMPSDNHARYAAAWRPDGIYVYVEVDDPLRLPARASDVDPWCGDGIELYVDADGKFYAAPDYDDPGTMQLLAAAPARDTSTELAVDALYHTRSDQRAGDWSAARHVMVPRANGYALEAFITAAELELGSLQLMAGGSVGLDIAINVSVADDSQKVGCGFYLGQYYLRVSRAACSSDSCRPYSNVAAFCTPTLQ